MKLNHKFRLVPVDEETLNLNNFEDELKDLRDNNKIPDYKKAELYEDLIARLRNYRESINTPPLVQVATPPSFVVPDYKLPKSFSDLWSRLPEIRTSDKGELVINNTVTPNTNINQLLDYALNKTSQKPNGYEVLDHFLNSKGVNLSRIRARLLKPKTEQVESKIEQVKLEPEQKPEALHQEPKSRKRQKTVIFTPTKSTTESGRKKIEHQETKSRRRKKPVVFTPTDHEETYHTPKTSRKTQGGRGTKRFYIRLW
ncbi:unnamed protein product, partial [Auanema sp. JU1783]